MSLNSTPQDLRPQFRLRPGRDDIVIAWITSFESRQRSRAIRRALRAYLLGQARTPKNRAQCEDQELAAALDALF
jgi:hypothetical protein